MVESDKSLTREDVLRILEANGGPAGAAFDRQPLEGVSLHYEAVREDLEAGKASWSACYSYVTHGLNLRGATLRGARLQGANLMQADLSEATLGNAHLDGANCQDAKFLDAFMIRLKAPGANFRYCDLRSSYLPEADLSGANLSAARLQGADLRDVDLEGAILCDAQLSEVNLRGARLEGANLFGAWLVNASLSRTQIGERLVQECETYENPEPLMEAWEGKCIPGRYAQAAAVYRALKNNFFSTGNYDDASWAYIKERKMRKKSHWPLSVRANYPAAFSRLPTQGSRGKWARFTFYGGHLLQWLRDWFFDVTSIYGERPQVTLLWAAAFVIGFAVWFKTAGGIEGAQTWLDDFNYSLGAFVTIGFGAFEAVSATAKTLTSVEALLGIGVLALLMFALGNRINRS
jgi:uncharacterized protein YjbI with pentapeptide repeats